MDLSVAQVPTVELPGPSAELSTANLLEPEEIQDVTTQLPFVGGPRPTMTKLKVHIFHIFLITLNLSVFVKTAVLILHTSSVRVFFPANSTFRSEVFWYYFCSWQI